MERSKVWSLVLEEVGETNGAVTIQEIQRAGGIKPGTEAERSLQDVIQFMDTNDWIRQQPEGLVPGQNYKRLQQAVQTRTTVRPL